jgi:glucose-6-phosphate 1-dehydrogenase
VGRRGGYFDGFGIIRDVMQNHLLQMMALTAMEPPATLSAHAIRDEKVRLLRCVPPVSVSDMVLGQYSASGENGARFRSYTEEEGVSADSVTPTYAAAVLRIENDRWSGVPFLLSAGKGLDGRMTEISVMFRPSPANVFCDETGCPGSNELVIRVQPEESVVLTVVNKVPGSGMRLAARSLDLRYSSAFTETIPDAYETLLMEVMRGHRSLFIRGDELAAAWDIFTPALHRIDAERTVPELYPFGSRGPLAATRLTGICATSQAGMEAG